MEKTSINLRYSPDQLRRSLVQYDSIDIQLLLELFSLCLFLSISMAILRSPSLRGTARSRLFLSW